MSRALSNIKESIHLVNSDNLGVRSLGSYLEKICDLGEFFGFMMDA